MNRAFKDRPGTSLARTTVLVLATLLLAAFQTAGPAPAAALSCVPTGLEQVNTDKFGYETGETVHFRGDGYEPSCTFTLDVVHPGLSVDSGAVTTDPSGAFAYDYLIVNGVKDIYLGKAVAADGSVMASVMFSDATACDVTVPSGLFPTISSAVAALPGPNPGTSCTITVLAGTYPEGPIGMDLKNTGAAVDDSKRYIIRADPTAAPGSVIVTTSGSNFVFSLSRSHFITIWGFEMKGATAGAGKGGVFLAGGGSANNDITIEGNHIHDLAGTSSSGAAGVDINVSNARTWVVNNLIRNNGRHGVSIDSSGPTYVVNNTIAANQWNGILRNTGAVAHLVNNLIAGNGTAASGGSGNCQAGLCAVSGTTPANITLINNMFYRNGTLLGAPLTNVNDIADPASVLDGGDGGNYTTSGHANSSASATTGIAGCVFSDCAATHALTEIFAGAADFHLRTAPPMSPAIDKGVNSYASGGLEWVPGAGNLRAFAPDDDFFGNLRPQDGDGNGAATVDIGYNEATATNQDTTTVLTANPPSSTYGVSVTFTAAVAAGGNPVTAGSVTFIEGGTCAAPGATLAGPASLDASGQAGFSKSDLSVTTHTLTACYGGAAGFGASSGNLSFTVSKGTPGFNNLSAPTIVYGATPTSLGGTIKAGTLIPSGQVEIVLNGAQQLAPINAGDGSFSSSFATGTLGAGSYPISYIYGGDASFNGASDPSLSLTVTRANQTITLSGVPATAVYGGTFTPSATATSGLTVAIDVSGVCSLSGGVVTMTSGTGSCTVTASQAGDANYNAAPDAVAGATATKANQTIAFTGAPATAIFGSTFSVSASAGSGLPVSIGASGACSAAGSLITMTSGSGTCLLTADQSGDADYNAAPQTTQTTSAQQAGQTITFGALADRSFGDADFTVGATGGGSGQPVTFTAAGSCTVSGDLVHLTSAGSCTITAHQAGDADYAAAPDVARTFGIADVTPPETAIAPGGPASPTKETSATFTFSGTDDVTPSGSLTFECSLSSINGGAFAACTSPVTYGNLADGSHTFQARATDAAGNVDPTPASFSWTVDTAAPDTIIDSHPSAVTNQTTASFAFHPTEAGATLACQLDGGAAAECGGGSVTYTGLLEGAHTFTVTAVDAAGNPDPTPATFDWTVDMTAPDTAIDSHPSAFTRSNSPSFIFHATEAGSALACQLDGGAVTDCSGGTAGYGGLPDGPHTFTVTATDAAGNPDPTPATFSWLIDNTAPDTSITAGPADGSTTTSTAATFEFTGTDDVGDPGNVLTFECSLDGAAFGACTSPAGYSALSHGQHTFAARAVDQAGNRDQTPATRTWTVEKLTPVFSALSGPSIAYGSTPTALSGTISGGAQVPTGSVSITLNGVTQAAPINPADGSFSSSFATGGLAVAGSPYAITYSYAGDATFKSAGGAGALTVSRASQTITFGALGGKTYGDPDFTLSATASSGLVVSFVASGNCAVSGDSVHIAGAGSCTITAQQGGDSNYGAAADVPQAFSIGQAGQTITFGALADKHFGDPDFAVSATASSGLPVSFTTGGSCAVSGNSVHITGVGSCTITARQGGNADYAAAPDAPQSFNISDNQPPDTSITAAPPGLSTDRNPSFSFTGSDDVTAAAGLTFECSLDGASFAACTSPTGYTSLPDGSHTLQVRARDGAGNADPTPASHTWTIDATPPDTLLDSNPPPVSGPEAAFTFHSTEAGSTFACQLDGGSPTACDSGSVTYTGLIEGPHTFTVAATDPAGNTDLTPAGHTWTVDATPPNTALDSTPSNPTTSTSATFAFHGSDPAGETYECQLDGGGWIPCTSPATYDNLTEGPHAFSVRAIDAAGNADPSPAAFTWTIGVLEASALYVDEDFRKLDGFDIVFGQGVGGPYSRIKNTSPRAFHHVITLENKTGVTIDAAHDDTATTIVTVPGMPGYCGFVPCSSQAAGAAGDPAFALREHRAYHVWPDDRTDDMRVTVEYMTLAGYQANGGSCAAGPNSSYRSTLPAYGAAKCIKITGYAIPVKHRARMLFDFEFRPKGTDGWSPLAKDRLFAAFAFHSATTLTRGSSSQTTTASEGIVGAGSRMTAVGGFVFNSVGAPQAGLNVRVFNSAAQSSCTDATNLVAQDVTDADGFYFVYRAGAASNEDIWAAPSLPHGVRYAVQLCSGGVQVGMRTMDGPLRYKQFEEVDFDIQ